MKKIVFLSLLAMGIAASCSTTRLPAADKVVRNALTAQNVRKSLADRYFTISMDYIRPRRVASRHLDHGYYIHVSGDSVYSRLPYIGRAYNVPYGGGDGLNFEGVMEHYVEKRTSADGTSVEFVVNTPEDRYRYVLFVYDDGKANLNVFSRERDMVGFTGNMEFYWE